MKNKNLSKQFTIGAVIFFHSVFSLAQTNYLSGAQQNVTSDAQLTFETCKMVSQSYYNPLTQKTDTRQVQDPACVSRNNQIASTRSLVTQGAQLATTVYNSSTNELKPPTAPVLADCGSPTTQGGFFNSAYSSCQQRNTALQKDYAYKTDIYNRALAVTKNAVPTTEGDLYAKMDDSTATGGLDEIQKKNEEGDQLYTKVATTLAGMAAEKFMASDMMKGKCSSGCSGCCAKAASLLAQGIAYMVLNGKSNKQADEHQNAAYESCTAYNQLSTSQKTCTPPASTSKYTRPEGCSSINVADCQTAISNLEGNSKLNQNAGGPSSFIDPSLARYAEILPDGSVKTKDGKVFSLSDFNDKNSLMAKGLTAAQAQDVLDQLNAKDGALAKAGIDAKGQLKGLNYSSYGSGGSGGGTKIVDITAGVDSGKLYKDKLKGLNDDEKNRKPSSEGLAKEFNGELIGVANDDIFLMMNRRYKRIGDQDTLITP